jgi:hypothetical protein
MSRNAEPNLAGVSHAPLLKEPLRDEVGQVLYRHIMPFACAPWSERGINIREEWIRAAEAVVERCWPDLRDQLSRQVRTIEAQRRQIAWLRRLAPWRWLPWI